MSIVTYDKGIGRMQMQIDMNTLTNYPYCFQTLNPKELGYDRDVTDNIFTVTVDVYALMTSLAIAYRVNGDNTVNSFVTIDILMEHYFDDGKVSPCGRILDRIDCSCLLKSTYTPS